MVLSVIDEKIENWDKKDYDELVDSFTEEDLEEMFDFLEYMQNVYEDRFYFTYTTTDDKYGIVYDYIRRKIYDSIGEDRFWKRNWFSILSAL